MQMHTYKLEWNEGTSYYCHLKMDTYDVLFEGEVAENKKLAISHTRIPSNASISKEIAAHTEPLMQYFLDVANELALNMIDFDRSTASLFKDRENKNHLYGLGFSPIEQKERYFAEFLGIELRTNGWFKDLTGKMKAVSSFVNVFKTQAVQKLDILLTKYGHRYTENAIFFDMMLKHGTSTVSLVKQGEEFAFCYNEQQTVFETMDVLERLVEEALEDIEKKQRIRMLYDPPKEHFHQLMKKHDIPASTSAMIYDHLAKEMNALDIEKECKSAYMGSYVQHLDQLTCFKFSKWVFLLDQDLQFIQKFEENDDTLVPFCLDFMKEKLRNSLEEEYARKVKSLEKKLARV